MYTRLCAFLFSLALGLFHAPATAFFVQNGQVYDHQNRPVQIIGINWFGAEGPDHVVHGLWARNWKDLLLQWKELGFNALRIPVCPETLRGVTPSAIDYWNHNPELMGMDSLELLDLVMAEAIRQEMYILLDHHRPDCKAISSLWYTDTYSEQEWINDLVWMAKRYQGPYLLGIDLKNEPHGNATWGTGNLATDWNKAAERAAAAVLAANPDVLIFVEGIQDAPHCSGYITHWWGGNLEPVQCAPLDIPADKLVFSPHVYGPDVFMMSYFHALDFPANMPAIWETHFGYLVDAGYTVIPGEFGGYYGHANPLDKIWQDALVDYFIEKGIRNFFYWSANPDSGGTGGILLDDWIQPRYDKVALLQRLAEGGADTPDPEPTPTPTPTPNPAPGDDGQRCELETSIRGQWQTGMVLDLRIHNRSDSSLDGWQLQWRMEPGVSVANYWNIALSRSDIYSSEPLDWNHSIPAGESVEFGLQLSFAMPPEGQPLQARHLVCGQPRQAVTPVSANAAYQEGFQAGSERCKQNPAACGIPSCDGNAVYQPASGQLLLSHLALTETKQTGEQWNVSLRQVSASPLLFEIDAIHTVSTERFTDDAQQSACELDYQIESQWQDGLIAQLSLRNNTDSPVDGWSVQWLIPAGASIINQWNMDLAGNGQTQTATPLFWNREIPAGGSADFGYQLAFSTPPGGQSFTLQSLSCGDTGNHQNAAYQSGLAAARDFCREYPALCGLPTCDEGIRYSAASGSVFLPGVGIQGDSNGQLWDVLMQQVPNNPLRFEVTNIQPAN